MEEVWKRGPSNEDAPNRNAVYHDYEPQEVKWPDPELLCCIKESLACWQGRHQDITSRRRVLAEDVKTRLAGLVHQLQDQSAKAARSHYTQDQDPTHVLEEKLTTLERVAAHMASEVEWSLVDGYYSSQAAV